MAKANSKKRARHVYMICLSFWVLVLIAAAVYGLRLAWRYAEEYEASRPQTAMDAYVGTLCENLMDDGILETISAMPHEAQSDEEVAEIVRDMLSNGISYVRKSSGNGSVHYSLRCGGKEFGVVTLAADHSYDGETRFGMLPWKVVDTSFDFDGLYRSVEVVVPRTFSVYLNDLLLDEKYIVEENIPYDVLAKYYNDYEGLPSKVRYRFDNAIGPLYPSIYDENGVRFIVDPNRDDSQFITACSEEELGRLAKFTAGFVVNYLNYTSGVLDPSYGYEQLKPYLVPDGDLDTRMRDAMDGLSWAHTSSVKVNSAVLNGAIALGDAYYLCDITSSATTYAIGHGEVESISNMRVIVVNRNDDIRAISLELY